MAIMFDTGPPDTPYPAAPGVFKGKLTIKGSGYVKITNIRTRACPGTDGSVSSWSIVAGKDNELEKGVDGYDIEVHLASYPQMFHDVDKIDNAAGTVKLTSFVDTNGVSLNWIPSLIVEGEILPELTCSGVTPSYPTGCDLLLAYDKNKDGKIDLAELIGTGGAIADWNAKVISTREMNFIVDVWGAGSINAKCPECYAPEVTITFVTKKQDGTELKGVSVYINDTKKGET